MLYGQVDSWEHYLAANHVYALKYQAPNLWIGSTAGLSSRNVITSRHRNYTAWNSTLPIGGVYSIDIDDYDNLWLGSRNAIVKMNMDSFELYDLPVTGTEYRFVRAILCQGSDVWAATNDAVYRFDGNLWQIFDSTNSPLPAFSTKVSLCLGTNGLLWVGTYSGLFSFDGTSWQQYTHSNSPLPSLYVKDVYNDADNNLWICTNNGLVRIINTQWQIYNTTNSELPSNDVNSIHQDSSGAFWIGTQLGLARYHTDGWTVFTMDSCDIAFDQVNEVCAISPDDLWVGTSSFLKPHILNRFHNGTWHNEYPTNAALTTNEINTLQLSANGNVWIGSAHKDGIGGAICFDGESWRHYGTYNSAMPCPCAHSVHTDYAENTYVSTCLGLVLINPQGSHSISQAPGYGTRIMTMATDQIRHLWTGGTSTGGFITRYDGIEWTVYLPTVTGMNLSGISTIRVDAQNRVWFGCPSGLTSYDGQNWSNYTVANGALFSNAVKDFCFDDSGNLWVANNALSRYRDGSWYHYHTENSPLAANDVCSLAYGLDGSLWIGTATNGIYRLFEHQWTHSDVGNSPLPDASVKRLLVDNNNTLWIAYSNHGLVLYNPNGLVSANDQILKPPALKISSYPNPFNPSTTIRVSSLRNTHTEIRIYNLKGQLVRKLYSGLTTESDLTCEFDGRDDRGMSLSSGVYLVQIKTPGANAIAKLSLMK